MTREECDELGSQGMVLVGRATPGAPCGDIYVSETLIAQKGVKHVREMVRGIYNAAYDKHYGRQA